MTVKPLVTVVINTYNYGQFIQRCIDSVLVQTYPQGKIEIIVVDDGSTDDTSQKVQKYGDKIKYIYKDHGGQATALNLGVKHSDGEYVLFLDADDMMTVDRVEKVVKEFKEYPEVGMVLNRRKIVSEEFDTLDNFPGFHNLKLNKENLELLSDTAYGTSRTAFSKSALKDLFPIPEEDLRIEADLYFNLVALWCTNVSSLDEPLTIYNIHGGNLYSIVDSCRLPLQISSMKAAINYVKRQIKESRLYDNILLEQLLRPYEVQLLERITSLNIINNKATRREILNLELQKLYLGWKNWGVGYKVYKLLSIPLCLIISPNNYDKLRRYYSKHKLFILREKIFN